MSELINFILKTKNCKESDIKKALKEAGIDIISIATVYKEKLKDENKKD